MGLKTKTPVIYQLLNLVNGKRYIGSTTYFVGRRSGHFRALERGIHHSVYLQRAFDKYGVSNFKIEIIETLEDEKEILIREQFYIETLKPEYNMAKDATRPQEVTMSVESNRKRAIKAKKEIFQYDLNMTLVREWDSIREAGNSLKIAETQISECCNGHLKTAKGFIFKFKSEFKPYVARKSYSKFSNEERFDRLSKSASKTYLVTDPSGERFVIKNLRDFAKSNGLNPQALYDIVSGFGKSHKKFKIEKYEVV